MVNHPTLFNRHKINLLAIILTQAVAALVLFLYFSNINSYDTLLLSLFGLCCMGVALVIVVSSSSHPMASLGVWFSFILAIQHGGGWILEQIFTDKFYTRYIFFTNYNYTMAKSVALAGVGLLAFSCTYAYYFAQRGRNNLDAVCVAQTRNSTIDNIPWTIPLILGVGILFFQISGGLNMFMGASTTLYWIRSIFGYLSDIVIILISVKLFASRFKTWIIYLILIVLWGGYIFLIGQRQYIVGISLTTLVLSYKWRLTTVKARHLILLGLFLLSVMVGTIFLRDIYGRSTFTDMTLADRLTVMSETQTVDQSNLSSSLNFDLGYRLNTGNVLLGLMADLPRVDLFWVEPVTFSAISMVPNIIWTSKAQVILYDLPTLISIHYGLPRVNYIATFITTFYAIGGLPTLIFLAGLFGIMTAFLDIRLVKNTSILYLILAIGLGYGLLSIDHSIDLLFLSLRNALLFYLLLKLSMLIKSPARKH